MEWKQSKSHIFWGEIAPQNHVAQYYKDESALIEILTGFVGAGINAGEAVIVIATPEHLQALENRLLAHVIYLPILLAENQYIPIVAEDMLSRFMRNDRPDPELFEREVGKLIGQIGKPAQHIRAFGEMVALLLSQGNAEATLELERLWNKVCQKHSISLFGAYPSALVEENQQVFESVCRCHTKIVSTANRNNEILYSNTNLDSTRRTFHGIKL